MFDTHEQICRKLLLWTSYAFFFSLNACMYALLMLLERPALLMNHDPFWMLSEKNEKNVF